MLTDLLMHLAEKTLLIQPLTELSLKVGDGGIGWHFKALFTRRSSRRERAMVRHWSEDHGERYAT
jgi:hypothetical protein